MSSRRLPLLVALCVLLLGTAAVLAVAALPGQRRAPSRAVVPAQLPGYSPLTAPLATNPVGAALALYRQDAAGGVAGGTQTLLLGADGTSARRLAQAAERGGSEAPAAAVLSPDGRTVAVGDGPAASGARAAAPEAPASRTLPPGQRAVTSPGAVPVDPRTAGSGVPAGGAVAVPVGASSTLALVDLATGGTRVHVVPRVPAVVPLSWSADGTRLAYLGTRAPQGSEAGAARAAGRTGQLYVFDTRSDRAVAVPGAEEVVAAAFSPDGARLAFQGPGRDVVRVVDPFAGTGPGAQQRETEIAVPDGAVLADGPAWSPDGSLLALSAGAGSPSARIEFVAAQPGRAVPTAVPGRDVLGWTSPDVLVHGTVTAAQEDLAVVRTDLRTGATSGYLRVPTAQGHHPAGDLTLASALLARAVASTGTSVDRGPWPLPVRLGLVVAAAVLAGPATAGLLRRRYRLAALTAVPEWARDTTRG